MKKEDEYGAMQSKQEPIFTDTETEIEDLKEMYQELKVMYYRLDNRLAKHGRVMTQLLAERNEPLVKRAWKRFLGRNFKGK
jgi:hypothetical protein